MGVILLNVGRYGSEERVPMEASEVTAFLCNNSGGRKSIKFLTTSCITGEDQFSPDRSALSEVLPQGMHYTDPSMFSSVHLL